MSYFGELLGVLKAHHPRTDNDALVNAFLAGIEAFAWMKDGVTYVGTCGTKLRDVRAEVEIARKEMR